MFAHIVLAWVEVDSCSGIILGRLNKGLGGRERGDYCHLLGEEPVFAASVLSQT